MEKEMIERIKEFVRLKLKQRKTFGSDDIAKKFSLTSQEAVKVLEQIL